MDGEISESTEKMWYEQKMANQRLERSWRELIPETRRRISKGMISNT